MDWQNRVKPIKEKLHVTPLKRLRKHLDLIIRASGPWCTFDKQPCEKDLQELERIFKVRSSS